jgi:hypothetical protein
MSKFIIYSILILTFNLTSCKTNEATFNDYKQKDKVDRSEIEFTILRNYYVKNNAQKIDNPKIENALNFNQIFGMATTMSEIGKPTTIDFSKEFVIVIILPETDVETNIEIKNLIKDDSGNLTVNYRVTRSNKQSYTNIPFVAIKVNLKEKGNVLLKELD